MRNKNIGGTKEVFTNASVSVSNNRTISTATQTFLLKISNISLGTGLNYGSFITSGGAVAGGTRIGGFFQAFNADPAQYAIGVFGQGNTGTSPAISIGVLGNASSGARRIGAYFSPNTSTAPGMPNITDVKGSACLILDEGGINADLLQCTNGTTVRFVITVGGGLRVKSASLGSVTLDNTNHVIRCDASAGAITLTLPVLAAANRGIWYRIKKIDATANTVTIAAGGGNTIDGAATSVLATQYQSEDVIAPDAGTDWAIFGTGGSSGSAGATGAQGIPGKDGEDGQDGFPGIAGPAGNTGPAGTNGIDGRPGYDGEDGEIGQMGIPGPTGPQGPAGSGGSATTVEVNVSATPVTRGKFTITDAAISAVSKVLVWQAPGPYTGKGTLADETELQPIEIIMTAPAAGSAVCYWKAKGHVAVMPQSYYDRFHGGARQIAVPTVQASMDNINSRQLALVIGRAQGNIKFSYMIL